MNMYMFSRALELEFMRNTDFISEGWMPFQLKTGGRLPRPEFHSSPSSSCLNPGCIRLIASDLRTSQYVVAGQDVPVFCTRLWHAISTALS